MTNIPLSGVLTPEGHVLTQRVYYEDTDFSGVVYHARYLHFMERGRTDYLRCLGIDQMKMHAGSGEGDGLAFVVHRMEIEFKASARMDDVLTIVTKTQKALAAKLVLNQEIRIGDKVFIAACVTIAVIDRSGRPRRLPSAIVAGLVPQTP